MVTGDAPATAAIVAKAVGLDGAICPLVFNVADLGADLVLAAAIDRASAESPPDMPENCAGATGA